MRLAEELDRDEKRLIEEIDQSLCSLRRLLDATYIRLWRYVDSQNVIFGFRWFESGDTNQTVHKNFPRYVGFRRKPLPPPGMFHPVFLEGPRKDHPYWHFPEFAELQPKRDGFIEAVLARGENQHELDGLVCAGISPADWENRKSEGHFQVLLNRLHLLTQLYSLRRFHAAFVEKGEVRLSLPSFLLGTKQPLTPQIILEALAQSLGGTASIYLRDPQQRTLIAGVGTFYMHLRDFEDPNGINALSNPDYVRSLISSYVAAEGDGKEARIYPGSPHVETYIELREQIDRWVAVVRRIGEENPKAKQLAEIASTQFEKIGANGSFGVFPVLSEETPDVQAQLCVASTERNFFRWSTKLAIRDAREQLAKNRPHAQPLRNLLRRVSDEVGAQLRASDALQRELLPDPKRGNVQKMHAFVMAVDIRRSTQLMRDTLPLHAHEYATFVTNLSRKLADDVKQHYGVFDKFTGDGVLAFFPTKIFAGDGAGAGLWTIAAAEQCHKRFVELFAALRSHLAIVEKDQGLGIGIDYGEVNLVDANGELTVVGIPVVYACRLAAAPAGQTLLNEQAFQEVKRFTDCDDFKELTLVTKDRTLWARAVPAFWSQKRALPRNFYWT